MRHSFRRFVDAWQWLCEHPAFRHVQPRPDMAALEGFAGALDVSAYWVDPKTNDYGPEGKRAPRSARAVVALEVGPYEDMRKWPKAQRVNFRDQIERGDVECPTHDPKLDSWGPTFEAAVLMLARKVLKHYGDYSPCSECFDLRVVPAGSRMRPCAKRRKKQ